MASSDVVFLVFEGVKHLDVAGPAEVFTQARRLGAAYQLRFASPSGAEVTSSTGLRLAVDLAASDVTSAGTVVIRACQVFCVSGAGHRL
ncbi:DJ-1/PfpI family protein [Microbacterium profundi]